MCLWKKAHAKWKMSGSSICKRKATLTCDICAWECLSKIGLLCNMKKFYKMNHSHNDWRRPAAKSILYLIIQLTEWNLNGFLYKCCFTRDFFVIRNKLLCLNFVLPGNSYHHFQKNIRDYVINNAPQIFLSWGFLPSRIYYVCVHMHTIFWMTAS